MSAAQRYNELNRPGWYLHKTVAQGAEGLLVAPELLQWLTASACSLALALGVPAFPVGEVEAQLAVCSDGDMLRQHVDNAEPENSTRYLSWVYYAHPSPLRFRGGELVLLPHDRAPVALAPEGDTLVIFPSGLPHLVEVVRTPSSDVADARVAYSGWIRSSAPSSRMKARS